MFVSHPFSPEQGIAREKKRIRAIPFWGMAGVVLLLGIGLLSSPAGASEPSTGEGLYDFRCAICHYRDRPELKFAPSLQGLFKRQNLINSKPVNEKNVSDWIANGSPNMPGFRYSLNQKEMQLLLEYLKKL